MPQALPQDWGRNHFRALNGVVADVCRDCPVSDSGQHQPCFQ